MTQEDQHSTSKPEGEAKATASIDIGALRKAQEARDIEMAQKKAEAQRDSEAKQQAESNIDVREALLADLKKAQDDMDALKATRIEERMARAESLRQSQTDKEAALKEAQDDLNNTRDALEEIKEFIAGKDESDIAPEVKDAIAQLESDMRDVASRKQAMDNELTAIESEFVSDEQIQRYSELLAQMDSLNSKVSEIEANSYVIDRLIESARNEDQLRDIVVREALGGMKRSQEQVKVMSQVVQMFLTEEFKIRGLDKIKEGDQSMQNLVRVIVSRVSASFARSDLDRDTSKDEWVGIFLRNLVGKFGTMEGTARIIPLASGGRTLDKESVNHDVIADYIRGHLGTINYLRAASSGLKTCHDDVLGSSFGMSDFDYLESEMRHHKLSGYAGGAMVPNELDEHAKAKVQEEFMNNMRAFEDLERNMIDTEKQQLEAQISGLESEMQQSAEIIAQYRSALELIDDARGRGVRSVEDARDALGHISEEIEAVTNLQSQLKIANDNLGTLGRLQFIKRGDLNKEIARIQTDLNGRRSDTSQRDFLASVIQAYEQLDNLNRAGSIVRVQDRHNKAKRMLDSKKTRADELNHALIANGGRS